MPVLSAGGMPIHLSMTGLGVCLVVAVVVGVVLLLWRVYDWNVRDMLDEIGDPLKMAIVVAFAVGVVLVSVGAARGLGGKLISNAIANNRQRKEARKQQRAAKKNIKAAVADHAEAVDLAQARADKGAAEAAEPMTDRKRKEVTDRANADIFRGSL